MINQEIFLKTLNDEGIKFFTGVPDSYLNGFCNYLLEHVSNDQHIIAANEGNAIGIAAGYYFSTNSIPLVYMQNSGMGNALNPIVSLTDKHVYNVPLLLLIGWRGEPGIGDWPQHQTQGEITTKLLEILNIPYVIASDDDCQLKKQVVKLINIAKEKNTPVALIARKGVFAGDKKQDIINCTYPLSREEAIESILEILPADTIYCATTGRATRELFYLREKKGESHKCDFLNVGAMGHASSVALGIALANRKRQIVCLDGDSAAIMHLGALTMASKTDVSNFLHIILNNGSHESVGGQPSAGQLIDFTSIARASGYTTVGSYVSTKEQVKDAINILKERDKPGFLDIRIHKGLKGELPPLKFSHDAAINELMNELQVNGIL